MPSRKQFLLLGRALGAVWKEHLNPRLAVRRAHPFLSIEELYALPGVAEALGPDEHWNDCEGEARATAGQDLLANMIGQASEFPQPWCVSDGHSIREATEAGAFVRPDRTTGAGWL